jgi:hypothetical protein
MIQAELVVSVLAGNKAEEERALYSRRSLAALT